MKTILFSAFLFCLSVNVQSQDLLDQYISGFNYEARKSMKVSSEDLLELLINKQAILLDIRFDEEQKSWSFPFALSIPLPELPKRYVDLDKNVLIVTACPHKDRAIMAMMFLKSKGFQVKYLEDGLLDLAEHLRGDKAREFIKKLD